MSLKAEIGNRIKEVRGNLSQQAFCKKLKVGQTTVGRYERGERSPDAEFLLLIKEHYGISPNWLISGEGLKHITEDASSFLCKEEIPEYEFCSDTKKKPSKKEDLIVVEHSDLVKDFKDQETAKEFNQYLIKIESDDPEGYKSLFDQAKTIYKTIQRLKKKYQHQNLGDNHQQNIQKKTV